MVLSRSLQMNAKFIIRSSQRKENEGLRIALKTEVNKVLWRHY